MEVVICEGDETGQELLVEALRVLDPDLLGIPIELHRFDLSLENRRRTANAVVSDAAEAMRRVGFGLKAATITPEKAYDVGSPNRILREAIGGSVIVRSGRRIPGVTPLAPVVHPIVVVRMAVGDAYGAKRSAGVRWAPSMKKPPESSGSTGEVVGPPPNIRLSRLSPLGPTSTVGQSGRSLRSTRAC